MDGDRGGEDQLSGLIVIVGQTCAGKSTLAGLLSRVLESHTHLSVGDLIRADRAGTGAAAWLEELERAYQGESVFPWRYISDLIGRAFRDRGLSWEDTILDGGPPLAEVLAHAGVRPRLTISLEAPDELRWQRLAQRRRQGERSDDADDAMFSARTARYARSLGATVAGLSTAGPVLPLNSEAAPRILLRQVLSALSLLEASDHSSRPGAGSCPADPADQEPAPVLLVKPGLRHGPALLKELERRARLFGLTLAEVRQWNGRSIVQGGLARAHYDRHQLFSAGASMLLNQSIVGGEEAARRHGESILRPWEESGPERVAPCVWLADVRARDGSVLRMCNGHMPTVLRRFEAPEARLVAVRLGRLEGEAKRVASWRDLRTAFLGATDPVKARAGSLRSDAARGILPVAGGVTFQNNGFHLSAGPLEALREGFIWFGGFPQEPDARNCALRLAVDHPRVGGGESSFDSTECMDWRDGAHETARRISGGHW